MIKKENRYSLVLECAVLLAAAVLCFHLLAERIEYSRLPGGDEGSWLSASAEWSRGNGFTTRWMEYHYQKPYTLPRPDDFRYPALVTILGTAFKFSSVAYHTGLWTVGVLFFFFCGLIYTTARLYFDRSTSILTLFLTVISLLQLHWNTVVYSEGLFGAVLAAILIWAKKAPDNLWQAAGSGLLLALLYLVRPNGILLVPALLFYYWWTRKSPGEAGRKMAVSLGVFILCLLPWWIRNGVYFGNPFHLAGSAGLLRESLQEPDTYSFGTFLEKYGVLFMIKRVVVGCWEFFKTLQFYEHGLQWVPLAGVVIGVVRRKVFYNLFIAGAFILTAASCFYANYNSWAGVRYFSPFLPFVYAFGVYHIFQWVREKAPTPMLKKTALLLISLASLSPVLFPHLYYERKFSREPDFSRADIADYVKGLQEHVPENSVYLAMQLGQLNFLTERNCVGIQGSQYETALHKGLDHFNPEILALFRKEILSEAGQNLVRLIREKGYEVRPVAEYKIGLLFKLQRSAEMMEVVGL